MARLKTAVKYVANRFLSYRLYRWLSYRPRLMLVDQWAARRIRHSKMVRMLDTKPSSGDWVQYQKAYIRKLAHILDKGLQHCIPLPGHSAGIAEALRRELAIVIDRGLNQTDDSIVWARKILALYDELQSVGAIEYDCAPDEPLNINIDDLEHLIKTRRSIRWFADKPVAVELIGRIAEGVNWSSNSCNRQAIKLVLTRDRDKIRECMSQNAGATCMNAPPLFVSVCYDPSAYIYPVEAEVGMLDTGLGLQNLLLLAHSHGLGTCVLNWSHSTIEQERALRSILNLPSHWVVVCNLLLGYPMKGAPVPSRKPIEDTVVWIY